MIDFLFGEKNRKGGIACLVIGLFLGLLFELVGFIGHNQIGWGIVPGALIGFITLIVASWSNGFKNGLKLSGWILFGTIASSTTVFLAHTIPWDWKWALGVIGFWFVLLEILWWTEPIKRRKGEDKIAYTKRRKFMNGISSLLITSVVAGSVMYIKKLFFENLKMLSFMWAVSKWTLIGLVALGVGYLLFVAWIKANSLKLDK